MALPGNAIAGPSTYTFDAYTFGKDLGLHTNTSTTTIMDMDHHDHYDHHDQHNGAKSSGSSSSAGSNKRGKTGCITCRLRKKRCDEAKPVCATCTRLGIECMGYGAKRPKWLREKDNAKKAKQNIKEIVSSRRSSKVTSGPGSAEYGDKVDYSREGSSSAGSGSLDATMDDERAGGLDLGPVGLGGEPVQTMRMGTSAPDVNFWTLEAANATASTSTLLNAAYSSVVSDPTLYPPVGPTSMTTYSHQQNQHQQQQQTIDDPSTVLGPADLGTVVPSMPSNEVGMDAIWALLMGQGAPRNSPRTSGSSPVSPFLTIPSPTATAILSSAATPTASPSIAYLQYFLTVVLPLQYRVITVSMEMADLVTPLALSRNEVLHSVSALAALHMAAKRTKKRIAPSSPRITLLDGDSPGELNSNNDADVHFATTSHRKTIERLRFMSPSDLTAEEIVISVLFSISYHLFSGGTSKKINELMAIMRRCLSAALLSSPEVMNLGADDRAGSPGSPWKRYRQLIEHMIWTDIIASVTQNKASQLLATYRRILDHLPAEPGSPAETNMLLMDRVMGCDSTTLLAMCEVTALSEWKDRAEEAGCLSYRELLNRAASVEKILNERAWRESHLDRPAHYDPSTEAYQTRDLRRIMSDVFFGSVKVLLAVVINGPFPRVSEVAAAVQDTMSALHRLDIQYPNDQVHRALVLPITVAGCHCETASQQAFFRRCFEQLGPEARAFGNTGSALELMEEVWRQRAAAGSSARIDWRQAMVDLGWEAGVFLI
ncbi:hypothetical protein I316_00517 [Kwoniella heveanensis BCC8398]|uniref:Zn(2)-C6 fungal-type domain-containing protein n=1 Tax=Kwoniella heveanensis BCC8398 TaxID=1296120 RepID=A0A1B9H2A1_9TREE|nr:hypothetical protein I316_00517 [Kwoniella heveanensis BCC8398]